MITDARSLGTKLKELIDDIYQFIQRKSMGSEPHSWYREVNEVFVKRMKKIIRDEKAFSGKEEREIRLKRLQKAEKDLKKIKK